MDDLPLQKIQISGPTLSSLTQRVSSSPADVDGLLFGQASLVTPSNLSDDHPSSTTPTTSLDSPTLIATITSFFCSTSTCTFYSPSGRLNPTALCRLLSSSANHPIATLIGCFSGRRKTPLRPSMRESSVTSSLSSNIQFSFQVENSTKPYTLSLLVSSSSLRRRSKIN